MRSMTQRLTIAGAAAFLVVGAAAAATLASTFLSKLPPDPWAGLSDAGREAQIGAAYDQQAAYIRAFNKSGQDPRELHRESGEAFSAGPETLGEAVGVGDLIVIATVRSVTFEPVDGQWLGHARVTVDVSRSLKGEAAASLELLEPGSPVPAADGSSILQEIDVTPVLMPGDRVLLILIRGGGGALTPLPGSGIVYFETGRARTLDRSPLRAMLNGQTETQAMALYLSAMP